MMIRPSCRTCTYCREDGDKFICDLDGMPIKLTDYCTDYLVDCEQCTHSDVIKGICTLKGIPYIKRHEDDCKDFMEA